MRQNVLYNMMRYERRREGVTRLEKNGKKMGMWGIFLLTRQKSLDSYMTDAAVLSK